MRIFHIITHFDIGGAERVAVNIAKSQTTRDGISSCGSSTWKRRIQPGFH